MNQSNVRKEPYIYSGNFGFAAGAVAGNTGQITYNISSEFDFLATAISWHATTPNANLIPDFDIQISSNEDKLFSDFVSIQCIAGMGTNSAAALFIRYPVGLAVWDKMPKPYLFRSRSTIVVDLRTQIAGIQAICFYVKGVRLYIR